VTWHDHKRKFAPLPAESGTGGRHVSEERTITPSPGDTVARASASGDSQAVSAGGDVTIDQSQHAHYHDSGQDGEAVPLIRRITAEDVPGWVGRVDELDRLARLLEPGAPRGGPVVLYPDNDQPGIGVTALAVQAASRALADGWFPGGAVLVSPHAGGEQRQPALGRTLDSVLDALGQRPGREARAPGGGQAAYQRTMEALAAAGKRVLIVIEEVWDADERLVDALAARGPHRLLLTAWVPPAWLVSPRRLVVRYLDKDESFDVLDTALSPGFSGSVRPADRPAHLRALARRCGGVVRALRVAADELVARPGLPVAELTQALADAYDQAGDAAGQEEQPTGLGRPVAAMAKLLTPVWGPPPQPVAAGRRVIGRRALLSWLQADYLSGQPAVWDVVAGPGSGKSTLLAAAHAVLAEAGARPVVIKMENPADSYERRRAGSDDPLVIELARTELCMGVARAVGEKLSREEGLGVEQLIYRADQDIRDALATVRPELDVADLLIPRGTGGAVSLPDRKVSEEYAWRVRTIRADLGRRVVEVLAKPTGAAGRLAVLIDNLHLVEDAACRQWLAKVFANQLGAVTVATRRPGDQAFCEDALTYLLRDFTRGETREYLQLVGRLNPRWVDERMLDALMGLTRGTPQAVAAQCDGLTNRLQSTISDTLDQPPLAAASADDLGRSLAASARQLVADACQEVLGRDLPAVLDYLVVLRHVNAGLLTRVLAGEEVTGDQVAQLAARLAEYSIMTSSDDDNPESFRLHERIRQFRLAEMPPDTVRRRHERAEQVYAELVAGFESEWDSQAADEFTVWARFESPEFQALLREWLFHAMRSQGRVLSQRTGVQITQVFLEAFWWWGFYLDSPVCEQLLRELDLISGDKSDADRQWLANLSTFYRNYRWGYVYNLPGSRKRDWAEIGSALMGVRRQVGLTGSRAMDPGRHAIDVITNVYRAQSIAFRDAGGNPQAAAELFAEARAAVRRSVAAGNQQHAWYDAWVVYLTADMWSSCGRPDKAGAGLHELDELAAADQAGELIDRDLVSRTMSLQGEVYLARGDYAQAIDACAHAALLVYAYHVTQETTSQPPNEYTYRRHAECIARAGACLAAVREDDPAAWRAGIGRMCVTFAPYWRLAGGPAAGQFVPPAGPPPDGWPPDDWPPADGPALPAGIIPPLPDRVYLGQLDSPFTKLATRLVDELGYALDNWVPFREPEPE
jgi:hypothetical protein